MEIGQRQARLNHIRKLLKQILRTCKNSLTDLLNEFQPKQTPMLIIATRMPENRHQTALPHNPCNAIPNELPLAAHDRPQKYVSTILTACHVKPSLGSTFHTNVGMHFFNCRFAAHT